ncbi:MAG: WhiB family transcriptional regulator [Actinobacteria bacterium]|nr:WhiB family transcriptional regulator [Actinomycetota bacterium]
MFDDELDDRSAFTADAAITPAPLDWGRARCRDGNGTLTHLFFSDEPIETARARAICGKCPLSVACLEGALERVEPWGVWGGELLESGRIVANKRPRGRPPKHPRPLVVINEDAIAVPVRVA